MAEIVLTSKVLTTDRHRTAYFEAGPEDGPLMIFLHGCPELAITWRHQLEYFASRNWRCIAPDMRGYGGSSVPDAVAAYAIRHSVADMVELHDALGGAPAVWVGHDWGSEPVWRLASHHPDRCRGVVSLTVPYIARGNTLSTLTPLVDRELYPSDRYPVGQWDYWLYYREHFAHAVEAFEADVASTIAVLYQQASPPDWSQPVLTANVRESRGWFGDARRAPQVPRDARMLSAEDFAHIVAAYRETGFAGALAWYMNDLENLRYAAEAPYFGRLSMPTLFVHAAYDRVCDTVRGQLAVPMREDVALLSEAVVDAGHQVMLEAPDAVNETIARWLGAALA